MGREAIYSWNNLEWTETEFIYKMYIIYTYFNSKCICFCCEASENINSEKYIENAHLLIYLLHLSYLCIF